jgi:hypothetical protein
MFAHNPSVTNALLMPSIYHTAWGFVRRTTTTVVVMAR